MQDIDLTPFGFTPTENLAYRALLELGPSGGYPLANSLGIARANVYQALRGLVAKGGAVLVSENPNRYRAVRPDAVYAMIVERCNRQLDGLEDQIGSKGPEGEDSVVDVRSERTLIQLVTRAAARSSNRVGFIAPEHLTRSLLPVWRKRQAENLETDLWVLGDADPTLPVPVAGRVDPAAATRYFGQHFCLFFTGDTALTVGLDAQGVHGYWTTNPVLAACIRAAFAAFTQERL